MSLPSKKHTIKIKLHTRCGSLTVRSIFVVLINHCALGNECVEDVIRKELQQLNSFKQHEMVHTSSFIFAHAPLKARVVL